MTVGEKIVKTIIPCCNVGGGITMCVPYTGGSVCFERNRAYGKEEQDALLKSQRTRLARYIDKVIAREIEQARLDKPVE